MPRHTEGTSPLATDPKKDSRPQVHLFELIERHRRFILGRTRGLHDHNLESSQVGLLAGAFDSLEESPVDPFAAVDELGGDHDNRMFGGACGAYAPKTSGETSSTGCPQCSAWLAAKRRALRPNCPNIRAVSTGRRNTCIRSFCLGFNFKGFTWSFVELTHHFV